MSDRLFELQARVYSGGAKAATPRSRRARARSWCGRRIRLWRIHRAKRALVRRRLSLGLKTGLKQAVIWRRKSNLWGYAVLLSSWCGLTWSIGSWLKVLGWPWWIGSLSLFLVLFEVGIGFFISAAYSSHRGLEEESEQIEELARTGKPLPHVTSITGNSPT